MIFFPRRSSNLPYVPPTVVRLSLYREVQYGRKLRSHPHCVSTRSKNVFHKDARFTANTRSLFSFCLYHLYWLCSPDWAVALYARFWILKREGLDDPRARVVVVRTGGWWFQGSSWPEGCAVQKRESALSRRTFEVWRQFCSVSSENERTWGIKRRNKIREVASFKPTISLYTQHPC